MQVIKFFMISALVPLSTLHGAADDGTVNVIKLDGTCVTIGKRAAQHSLVLHDLIIKYPTENTVSYGARASEQEVELLKTILQEIDASAQNFAEAEQNLGDSMLPEVRKMYKENANATLGCYIESDTAFVTIAGIAHAYRVPRLNKALIKEFAILVESRDPKNATQNKKILEDVLQQMAQLNHHAQELTPLQKQGVSHIGNLIQRAMIKDKKRVLAAMSAGIKSMKKPASFFTGVSIGELIAHKKERPAYVQSGDNELKCVIKCDGITSLEGLECDCDASDLQKKKRLRISDTGIDYLPTQGFMRVHNPEIVSLHDNQIKEMHMNAFAGLSALTALNLSNNKLKQLPAGVFDCLTSLKVLLLSHNELVSFDAAQLLGNNRCIERLDLDNNQLEEIPAEWPISCAGIEELELSSNRIHVIPSNLFNTFKKLKRLSVDCNQIQEIQPEMFAKCDRLEKLCIFDNRIPGEQRKKLSEELSKVRIN